MRVVLASGNAGKAKEFARLLDSTLSVERVPGHLVMPEETGKTFEANARLKAESVASSLGGNVAVLADDSGLEVEALGGGPGVLSARYAGASATDEENVSKLLAEMSGLSNRRARFVCRLCLVLRVGRAERVGCDSVEAEGILRGEIVEFPRGDEGFGYDPVFQPQGWSCTLGEARPEDKDGVSHRGAASRDLVRRLRELGIV